MNKKKLPLLKPHTVDVKKGKKYAWCSCGLSSKQPYCDGSHSETKFKPVFLQLRLVKLFICVGASILKNHHFVMGLTSYYNFFALFLIYKINL